jgi:hypothetical protein
MKIAVILPVYNPNHRWLDEAIKSVIEQKTKHDITLFIRFDGDNNGYIAPDDKRVVIIKDAFRRGLSGGLNYMFNYIIGNSYNNRFDYFARIDADDIWHSDKLEEQIKFAEDKNLNICGTWASTIDESSNIKDKDWSHCNFVHDIDELFRQNPKNDFLIDPSPIINGKLIYDGLIHYNNAMLGGADYELWLRLSAMRFKIGSIPKRLYYYRLHNQGTNTKSDDWKNTSNSCFKLLSEMYSLLANSIKYYTTYEQYRGKQ